MRRFLLSFALLVSAGYAQPAANPAERRTVVAGRRARRTGHGRHRQADAGSVSCAGRTRDGDGRDRMSRRRVPGAFDGQGRRPDCAVAELARRDFLCAEVPAGTEISPSGGTRGRAAGHPHGAIQSGGVPHHAGPHRDHGVLGGRTSGIDRGDAFRRGGQRGGRPDRPAEQPPGLSGAVLSGDFVYRPSASGFAAQSARRKPRSRSWWRTCRTRRR